MESYLMFRKTGDTGKTETYSDEAEKEQGFGQDPQPPGGPD